MLWQVSSLAGVTWHRPEYAGFAKQHVVSSAVACPAAIMRAIKGSSPIRIAHLRSQSIPGIGRVAGLLAAAALLPGCAAPRPAGGPDTVTVAVQSDITGLYPTLRNESFSFSVNANIFEGLTAFDHQLRPEPALADRWENPDDETWIFHLRPGVTFSDGQPVRAADVVASLRFAAGLDTTQVLLAPVASVDELSEALVRVRTRFACPVLLSSLTFAFVLPEAALRQRPVPPTGTGPYKLSSWTPGRALDLEANPHYRAQPPAFARARFVVAPDPERRLAELSEGRADVVENVPLARIGALRRDPTLHVVSRPGLRVLFLALRVDEPPFSSAPLREAIDLALDRDELVRRALGGFGSPAAELVPATVLGYNPDLHVTVADRARARDRLRAAGYPSGLKLRLDGPGDRYVGGPEIMREVARQLQEVGVAVEVNVMPKERFFSLADSGRYQLLLYGWSCETIQAGEALDELIRTPRSGAPPNPEFLSDPALDRLIDEADAAASLDSRSQLLREALARVAELRPIVPLVVQNESFAFSSRIEWDPSLDMALHVADMSPRRKALLRDPRGPRLSRPAARRAGGPRPAP